MPAPKRPRSEMIRKLVAHSVSAATEEAHHHWLHEVFENGFVGYRNISDEQLRTEMTLHGLDASDDGDSAELDFDDEVDYEFVERMADPHRHRQRTRPSRKNADE